MQECVDAIARLGSDGKYVVIERLTEPKGLALVGGRIEEGESAQEAIKREFYEETGFSIDAYIVLGIYDDEGRDPRGPKSTIVYYGAVHSGRARNEPGKTKVLILSEEELIERLDEFVFDHTEILRDYFAQR